MKMHSYLKTISYPFIIYDKEECQCTSWLPTVTGGTEKMKCYKSPTQCSRGCSHTGRLLTSVRMPPKAQQKVLCLVFSPLISGMKIAISYTLCPNLEKHLVLTS